MPLLLLAAAAPASPIGPSSELFGIRFVGVNPENRHKVLLTLAADRAAGQVLARFGSGIGIASGTCEIVGLPSLRFTREKPAASTGDSA